MALRYYSTMYTHLYTGKESTFQFIEKGLQGQLEYSEYELGFASQEAVRSKKSVLFLD
jgi:hypothetical protein